MSAEEETRVGPTVSHDDVGRPRPVGKYWTDYEDWKVKHPSAVENFEAFTELARGKLLTVFLDYDGTISEIVNQPELAFMTDEMRLAVSRVASLYPTAIISGRSREKVFDFVKLPQLYYAGSHGLDIVGPQTEVEESNGSNGDIKQNSKQREMHQPAPWAPAVMDEVFVEVTHGIKSIPGATVDHNKFCVSVHYRNCANREDWTKVKTLVEEIVAKDPTRLKQAEGRKVFEVKPRVAWDKGKALSYLLGQLRLGDGEAGGQGNGEYGELRGQGDSESGQNTNGEGDGNQSTQNTNAQNTLSLYFGDDHTDEDAFHELMEMRNDSGCGIIVSSVPKPSYAKFSVKDPSEVLLFLHKIADLAERGVTKKLDTKNTL